MKFQCFFVVVVVVFLVCRVLKPALKSFGVIVGLLCKLNIGHFLYNVGLNSTLVVKLSVLFVFDGALKPALKPALTLLVFLLVCHENPTLNANDVGLYPTFSPFSNSKMK